MIVRCTVPDERFGRSLMTTTRPAGCGRPRRASCRANRIPSPGTVAPPSVDLVCDAPAVDLEQLAGVRLDDDQRLAVRRRVDAVHVEAGLVDDVAGERDRRAVPELPVAADRHLVEERPIESVNQAARFVTTTSFTNAPVVGEVELRDVRAGAGVVDEAVAGRPAGDEESVPLIDVDADRRPPAIRDEPRPGRCGGCPARPAGRDRAHVERVALDRDPLRLPAVRQVDVPGPFGARGGKREARGLDP